MALFQVFLIPVPCTTGRPSTSISTRPGTVPPNKITEFSKIIILYLFFNMRTRIQEDMCSHVKIPTANRGKQAKQTTETVMYAVWTGAHIQSISVNAVLMYAYQNNIHVCINKYTYYMYVHIHTTCHVYVDYQNITYI